MQNAFDFYLPTRLCFGSGARRRLPEQLTRLGVRNLLLCTDKMLRSAGVVEKITSVLDGCADVRYTIYDDVTENPGNSVVDNGYALARELGCDGVLGLGGGSALRYVCTKITIAHTSTHTATAAIASTMMRFMLRRFFFIALSPRTPPPSAASAPATGRSIS